MSTEVQAQGLSLAVTRLREALSVLAEHHGWESWDLGLASDGSLCLEFATADEDGSYTLDPDPDLSDWEDLIELTDASL